jgi:hypothetical protein
MLLLHLNLPPKEGKFGTRGDEVTCGVSANYTPTKRATETDNTHRAHKSNPEQTTKKVPA